MGDPVYHGANSDDAKVLCIVVHGRGQTQDEMMASIVARLDLPFVRFALPKSDDVGWYAARAIDPLTDHTLSELDDSISRIRALVADERAKAPGRKLLLCGFSQGACLSVEILMRGPMGIDAACLLTACRIGAPTDDLPIAVLDGLPVYASCGDNDPWIPQEAYHHMLMDLTRAGARIRTDMFPGRPHEITDIEIGAISDMLQDLAADHAPLSGATP